MAKIVETSENNQTTGFLGMYYMQQKNTSKMKSIIPS